MNTLARYAIEWSIIIVGILLHGVWLLFDLVELVVRWLLDRKTDEELMVMYRDNMRLDVNDADADPSTGVRDSFLRIFRVRGPYSAARFRYRLWHDLKNGPHEWAKNNPKGCLRVCGALILFFALV